MSRHHRTPFSNEGSWRYGHGSLVGRAFPSKVFVILIFTFLGWMPALGGIGNAQESGGLAQAPDRPTTATAVFGGGCFWCIEAVFERVWGVMEVESGYAGGHVPHPTYQQVLTDRTGHAEVCRIEFDPAVISYDELLRIFFKSHDPTSLNAQGPDHGTRYRSVVFTLDEEQERSVQRIAEELKKKRQVRGKIVTQVAPLTTYFRAEEYHQDYFAKHPDQPYCEINIRPKIGKFERGFKDFSKLQQSRVKKDEKARSGSNAGDRQ